MMKLSKTKIRVIAIVVILFFISNYISWNTTITTANNVSYSIIIEEKFDKLSPRITSFFGDDTSD
ncbi:MAG: hypothetical protein ACTSO5_13800, partial [Candidatus Heimdallarchaeaceae archaeon]